jgi:tRNA threonylcarbamoyladenosine biosynthesis protein TsaB
MSSLILSIETSTSVGSVALHKDGVLVTAYELHAEKSHSGALTPMVEQVFKYTGYTMQELDAIAISKGPGSYTGLRIGTSTAKGLCFALDKPLIAINTLEAMAAQVARINPGKALFCPMLDARRMEVFCLLARANGQVLEETHPLIVEEGAFAGYLKENEILFFGNGAAKCKPLFASQANALFIDGIYPVASEIGYLASKAFNKGAFEDVAYFEPFYLKDFQGPKLKA